MDTQSVNKEERAIFKSLLKFFKTHKYDQNDKEINVVLEEAITRVFQIEMQKMGLKYNPGKDNYINDVILKIINEPKNILRGCQRKGKTLKYKGKTVVRKRPRVVFNKAKLYFELDSDDREIRLFACKNMFKTIFHEIEHMIQHDLVEKSISSKETLMYARDFALKDFLGKEFYIGKNYPNFAIEAAANYKAWKKYKERIEDYEPEIDWRRDIEIGRFHLGEYVSDSVSGKRDEVATKFLDYFIYEEDKTYMLERYPALYKEYNYDGSRKNAFELLQCMNNEEKIIQNEKDLTEEEKSKLLEDCKEMYYELMYIQLKDIGKDDFLQFSKVLEDVGKSDLLIEMYKYMEKEEFKNIQVANKMIQARSCLNYTIEETSEELEEKINEEYERKKDVLLKLERIKELTTHDKEEKIEELITEKKTRKVNWITADDNNIEETCNSKKESKVKWITVDDIKECVEKEKIGINEIENAKQVIKKAEKENSQEER